MKLATPHNYIGVHNLLINKIQYVNLIPRLNVFSNHIIIWKEESLKEDQVIKKKILDEEDNFCQISYEVITENNLYMECGFCNKKYFEYAIKMWLNMRNESKTCPNCREIWINFAIYLS